MTGFVCALCALCYAEFAAMIPIAGSAYSYALSSMGEFVAWIIAWALVLEYAVGNMAVAVGWTASVKDFLANNFNIVLPNWMTSNTIDTVPDIQHADPSILVQAIPFTIPFTDHHLLLLVQKAFNLPAMLSVVAISCLLFVGISESARTAALMVFTKLAVILLFIFIGAVFLFGGHMDVLNQHWFADGWKTFAPHGFDGIIAGSATIFFAYIGFDAVSTAAEETKNPKRDIPIGILGSLVICTLLYILVSAIITAVTPLDQINKEAAVVGAMRAMSASMGNGWLSAIAANLINIGAIAGLSSVLLVFQMGGTRILYAISRDGLLPPAFAKLHPKFKTPYITTILMGIFVALGAGLLPINLLAEMSNIGTLATFMVVAAGVGVLRFVEPKRARPFKTPLGITFPLLGAAGCLFVMTGLPAFTWVVAASWFALGQLVYFGYGYWNSRLGKELGQPRGDIPCNDFTTQVPPPQLVKEGVAQ
jgi:APA family basic amino acid/polyamine antiporter